MSGGRTEIGLSDQTVRAVGICHLRRKAEHRGKDIERSTRLLRVLGTVADTHTNLLILMNTNVNVASCVQ